MPRERAYGKRGELLPRPPSLALLLRSMRCAVPKLGTLCAPWTHALKRLTRDLVEMAISAHARAERTSSRLSSSSLCDHGCSTERMP